MRQYKTSQRCKCCGELSKEGMTIKGKFYCETCMEYNDINYDAEQCIPPE